MHILLCWSGTLLKIRCRIPGSVHCLLSFRDMHMDPSENKAPARYVLHGGLCQQAVLVCSEWPGSHRLIGPLNWKATVTRGGCWQAAISQRTRWGAISPQGYICQTILTVAQLKTALSWDDFFILINAVFHSVCVLKLNPMN